MDQNTLYAIIAAGLVIGVGLVLLTGGRSNGSRRAQTIGKTGSVSEAKSGLFSFIKAEEDNRIKKLITLGAVCDFKKRTSTNCASMDIWLERL